MKILLVEDEIGIREVVALFLTRAGFKVDSTGDGTKALQMFRKKSYDLVITDLAHPGLNGAELIGKIYKLKPFHPVLLFTSSPIPTIAKPSEMSAVVAAARSLTAKKARRH